MSNSPVTVNLGRPSDAYREATGSLVYRLSELMFGSLLAAYSLGFFGAIAARGSQVSEHGRFGIGLLALQYICISTAFAYLTTSFYLTYHVGILTMPRVPLDRLGRDFSIAFFQAVFFGVSMLVPALFPVLLSLNFFLSARRKNEEYRRLADRLFSQNCAEKPRDESDDLPIFRKRLATHLRSKRQLSAWAPIGTDIWIYGLLALVIGVGVISFCLALEYDKIALPDYLMFTPRLKDKWVVQQLVISFQLVVATFIIRKYGSKVLKLRGKFIGFPIRSLDFCRYQAEAKIEDAGDVQENSQTDEDYSMDGEFKGLPAKLKEICDEVFA